MPDTSTSASTFRPLVIGAQYPALERGLTADTLAAQGFGTTPYTVCTSHVVAGNGVVTDVLEVPADTVSAQLEHIFETRQPTAAKVGVVGSAASAEAIFKILDAYLDGPLVLDLTLSGPSGEDIAEPETVEIVSEHMSSAELVSASLTDATLLAGMEIPSLDDAQVAAQRVGQLGASNVLLRCGRLATHHFDTESEPPNYSVDLFYDGEDLAVFEAPFIEGVDKLSGRASGLMMSVLHSLWSGRSLVDALRASKAVVTDAIHEASQTDQPSPSSVYFGALHHRILSDVTE
ncbi:bifunctional hydroxymethylpyrimidine kinase/phosphomethylpyrimidine kinase [Longibacter salinarum]|uniref:bifunctional hydroxymethylpyrimidine kinase/phosphomethylpyrimidine kinase n=1 Tax=Longibacter salinarum TaxID=1850348 RepID=UPI0015CF681F|nr:bifunctional hydroxymethylpyrimidine kinase/phosphomethylpyrimidine kinase [Longibacter salinarum]